MINNIEYKKNGYIELVELEKLDNIYKQFINDEGEPILNKLREEDIDLLIDVLLDILNKGKK